MPCARIGRTRVCWAGIVLACLLNVAAAAPGETPPTEADRAYAVARPQIETVATRFSVARIVYQAPWGKEPPRVSVTVHRAASPPNLVASIAFHAGPDADRELATQMDDADMAFARVGQSAILMREFARHPDREFSLDVTHVSTLSDAPYDDFIPDMKRLHHAFPVDTLMPSGLDTIGIYDETTESDWLLFSDGRTVLWHYVPADPFKPADRADVECWQSQRAWCAGQVYDARGQDITDVFAQEEPGTPHGTDYLDLCRGSGRYNSWMYGFEASFPKDLLCLPDGLVGSIEHGATLPLGEHPTASISLHGEYNAMFYRDARAAARAEIDAYRQDKDLDRVSVRSLRPTHLGGLDAMRVVLRYRDRKTGRRAILDDVIALRTVMPPSEDSAYSHYYSVALDTPEADYPAHRKTFEDVLATWKATRAEDSPDAP